MLALLVSSCLKDDDSDVVYYNDVAIISAQLGTMSREMHTTSSKGQDSVYYSTFVGSQFPLYIDQLNGKIYNADSLPCGTKTKAIVTLSAKNGGYISLKKIGSDSLEVYSATDSIDLSQPRVLRVFANDGSTSRDYTLELRVHKEFANVFTWDQKSTAQEIAELNNMRAFNLGDNMVVYGTADNAKLSFYATALNDGNAWTSLGSSFAANATVVANGTTAYALSEGQIYSSTDAANWNNVAAAADLKSLIGVTSANIYALANDGSVMVSADGINWEADALDDDPSLFPTTDINAVAFKQRANSDIEKVIVIGNRDASLYPEDGEAKVWSKLDGALKYGEKQPWMYQMFEDNSSFKAPALEHLCVTPYAEGMLMIGGNSIVDGVETALSKIRYSIDQGLTWHTDKRFFLPDGFNSSNTSFAMSADKNNYLWLFCGTTGQVWKGHLSQLLWAE